MFQHPFARAFVVFAVLGLVVLLFGMVTWPRPWDMLVEHVLLRGAKPSPWPSPPDAASLSGCYALTFRDCVLGSDEGKGASRRVQRGLSPSSLSP
jgi:hypothetical protein